MKKIIIGGLAVLAIGLGMAPAANADPFGVSRHGLREDPLGLPGLPATQHRDGPVQADGSWMRYRVIWAPAHHVAASSYCGTYSCSYSGGYDVDESIVAKESYVVFPSNVLPDEPGWLPTGTAILR